MPLVWCLKLLGIKNTLRVTGPFLTPYILQKASECGIPVGFYGGASQERLDRLLEILSQEYPDLQVPYAWAPPFRPLTDEEDATVRKEIAESGVKILFVGLGCPKQERWVASHTREFDGVMLGVGAAFDFIAGIKPMAPVWMQNTGLEWLYRLLCEPKRLWKRYLKQNPAFILLFMLQLTKIRRFTPHL
jgi:N-acetylglucosaminyldiphosphoundecaprenol N-acetyl-beta-D-mannosaminyltransferase